MLHAAGKAFAMNDDCTYCFHGPTGPREWNDASAYKRLVDGFLRLFLFQLVVGRRCGDAGFVAPVVGLQPVVAAGETACTNW